MGTILQGRGASPGVTGGTARVIRTPAEAEGVQPTDIMVVEMTTPDYVAAMRRASGVIAARGGITSHAAVVAREMNKPCIVALADATTLISDGDRLIMNGDTGTVEVSAPSREPE